MKAENGSHLAADADIVTRSKVSDHKPNICHAWVDIKIIHPPGAFGTLILQYIDVYLTTLYNIDKQEYRLQHFQTLTHIDSINLSVLFLTSLSTSIFSAP